MELLTWSLLCALLTSAGAGPAGLRLHQDADIQDSDLTSDLDQDWMDLWMRSRYTAVHSSSSESQSSEESSEEPAHTQPPTVNTPPASTAAPTGVPVAMTTAGTDLPTPTADNSTVPEPCPTTGCVTIDIPTSPPVTGSRGDN